MYQIRAKVFGGDFATPAWSSVGGALNYNSARYAYSPRLANLNGGLVVAFMEATALND